MGGSANRPRMDQFETLSTFYNIKSELKGVRYMKKLLTHVFVALQCRPIWTNGDVSQLAQIGPILTFNNIFLYKIKIQRWYIFWKKLPSHVIRPPCNYFMAILCKQLLLAKIGIDIFGLSAHGHRPKFFI